MGDTMFGYVKVYQPQLKMGEFEQYRGVYCSLCRTLGKRYGILAQMTLSYDVTFLALLHLSLAETCVGFQGGRCPYNPLKKRLCCHDHAALDFCADAAMMLVYHKTLDTLSDDRFSKRLVARLLLPFYRRYRRKAAARQPELDTYVLKYMDKQKTLESDKVTSVDQAAEPTAQILSRLCQTAGKDEAQREILARFGYCLGRWVYLIDATDDLADDFLTGNYNPVLLSRDVTESEQLQTARESMLLSLNASLAECRACYEELHVEQFGGILSNVLEWGIPHIQQQVLSGEKSRRTGGFNNAKSV